MIDQREGMESTAFPIGLCKSKEVPMVLTIQRDGGKCIIDQGSVGFVSSV